MKLQTLILIFVLSGCCWGVIGASEVLLNDSAGTNSQIPVWAALLAGACTGMIVGGVSSPVYRRLSSRHLLWVTPLSLYLSIGCFVALSLSFSHGFDFAEIIQTISVSWWALTFWFTLWPLFMIAYLNHRLLWHLTNKGELE